MLQGKRLLVIIGGGIAAYKVLDLIRRASERGLGVRVIMTRAAQNFVTPLSVATLTGEKVFTDLFDLTDEAEIGHIELSRSADVLVVAPATAHLLARMAQGLSDDLATTALLATDKPVLVAPAMNVRMWNHAATRRNLAQLIADGIHVVGPNEGAMACHEYGPGRMAEPLEILSAVERILAPGTLSGLKVLVTAGPTYEALDPVRYIANRSSGRQGYAIAKALRALGADVTLVSGPVALSAPEGVRRIQVESAREMAHAVEAQHKIDVAVMSAAVADWRPAEAADLKIKKGPGGPPRLDLVENPDLLATISKPGPQRPRLVIGFAAETNDVIAHAQAKLARKGCDWIIANDVSPAGGAMGGLDNQVTLITAQGVEAWPTMAKDAVAQHLAQRIAAHFGRSEPTR